MTRKRGDHVVSIGMAVFAWGLLILTWVAVFVAAGAAQGAPPMVATIPQPVPAAMKPYQAICHIQYAGWSGSGTLIGTREDGTGLVLSCRHVNQKVGDVSTVTWPLAGNQKSAGVVYEVIPGRGFDTDLALVVCRCPSGVKPIRLVEFDPAAGPFVGTGWRNGQLRIAVSDVAALKGQSLIWMPSPFVGGMSGGALLNRRGEQVAVVVASDRTTWGVSCDGPLLKALITKYRSER